MTTRIRHCIECPRCSVRYLIGFSPYSNGSIVVVDRRGLFQGGWLYCSCGNPGIVVQWNEAELKECVVSAGAYRRGYGSKNEIMYSFDHSIGSVQPTDEKRGAPGSQD